jgi:hypothetical protein
MRERVLRRRKAGAHFIGIFVAQFVQREGQRPIERRCFRDRFRRIAEEPCHLGGRLEIALGIDGKPPSGLIDRQVLADAGQHILQFPPVGVVIEHVVDGNERHVRLPCDLCAARQPRAVIAAIEHVGGQPHAAGGGSAQNRERFPWLDAGFFLVLNQPEFYFRPLSPRRRRRWRRSRGDLAGLDGRSGSPDMRRDGRSRRWCRFLQQGK